MDYTIGESRLPLEETSELIEIVDSSKAVEHCALGLAPQIKVSLLACSATALESGFCTASMKTS